ncbi:NHS-like protein 1 isoform X2 [Clarias gariepinus]|uniref:NHS-like protein 1 isoform X2 n=1 Tax=Clarias gariepinus TaxID=13013 RepID=UPI00234DB27D|nr:NHS-like protein 1 isoform X2 [Clarias gariepinus]
MIGYIDCISPQPAGKCFNRTYYEDEDELLPLYIHNPNNFRSKNGGSLRRRLLTSKMHQQQERLFYARDWDGPRALKSIQPLQKQHNSTFKPMQEDLTAVSSLDEESKWSVHYTAPWHQQENVFLPGSRPPCVEDLHCQAKVNLRTVLRECDKLRKDGLRSSQYYSQSPTFTSPLLSDGGGQLDQDEMRKKKKSSETSAEEEKLVCSFQPQTPLLDNIGDITQPNSWSKCLPLPTPEEKMRQQAESVSTDIVPINITGENFDRQASFRRTIINTDTIIRRSKRVKRRKTITGVPDSIKRELASNEQTAISSQSMYITGQYSTLGHVGSMNSSLKHLVTRDSGCQTDDVKFVPPSMRRIRSQRSHGLATQMANLSLSSSGSISTMSDGSGAICPGQLNASDQSFHSLPRQGARICLQNLEANCNSSTYLTITGSTISLPYQVTTQHSSPDSQHMPDLRKNTSVCAMFDTFYDIQNKCQNAISGCMVSSHNSSTYSLNAGVVLQNTRNLSSVHSSQSFDSDETPVHPMPSCPSEHPFSSSGTSCSANSSSCHSPASLRVATETESQCSTLNGRDYSPTDVYEDSDMSESSIHSCSTLTTDHWMYKSVPLDQCTSSCSSPIGNVCLDHSAKMTDSISLVSIDTKGCYNSMNLAPNCKSYSHSCINIASNARHNFYECKEHHSHDDRASLHSNQSLTRSISLRKAKKPPLPPKRTDSLHCKPQRKPHHNVKLLNDHLISCLHEPQKSHSVSYSSQIPFSGLEDPWVLGPRSQSSVSVASSGMSAPAAMCPTTPIHSDSSSQHSEYTESWDFQMDFPQSCSEHEASPQIMRPVLTSEDSKGSDSYGIQLTACIATGINTNMPASPDKVQLMTSPSSGYSSQSITPTAGTPVISLLRAKTPSGRPKPKVPERKSSLRSSVSSYSTLRSSNTSDSVKSLPTPPPLPKTLPGFVRLQSSSTSPIPSHVSPITPVQSPLATTPYSEERQSSTPVTSIKTQECKTAISISPGSPSQISEVSSSLVLIENKMSPLSLPPPLLLQLSSSVHTESLTSPLLGTGLQPAPILKATNSFSSLNTMENGKELNFKQTDKPAIHERPVITAQALQRVQLRPIKLMNLENIFTDIITTVCGPENQEHNKEPGTSADKPVQKELVKNVITVDSVRSLQNGMHTSDFPSKESAHTILVSNPALVSHELARNTHSNENILDLSPDTGPPNKTSADGLQSTVTPCTPKGTQPEQRSPISPKKSNYTLVLPHILHQSALNGLEDLEVTDRAMSLEPETLKSTSLTDAVNQHEISLQLEFEVESDSQNSTPVSPRRHSLSSDVSSDSLTDTNLTGLTLSDQDFGLCDTDLGLSDKDLMLSDDKGITDDSLSSSSGSVIFKEEENYENDAVFDSGTDSSSPTFSSTGEDIEEMMTPTRSRTTDDLFAAIHRSKRKVLGRCESEEEHSRASISSLPITPTSSSPSISWMHRQSSSIQRRLRRSTTSNDSFKALLLKKGSRSEPGFRMSAMEMLKSTDPRLQRPNTEASSPFLVQCTSPGRSRRASEEWARTEGALPRLSPSLTHSKYGRSSTPPCAASSRYNSRSRIPSGPMTVICEREGEQTESVDCYNIPFPVSLSSSGTVCAQGST